MTKEDIIQKCNFEEYSYPNGKKLTSMYLNLYVKSFGKEIPFTIGSMPSLESEPELAHVTKLINEIIEGEIKCPSLMKKEIFNHYNACIDNCDYGQVEYDNFETELAANKAFFKINSPKNAYEKLEIKSIYIHSDLAHKKLFQMHFKIPWDNEHGIIIFAKDLKFVGLE